MVMPRSRSRSMSSSICSRKSRLVDGAGLDQELIGQGALAVVDVGDDGEIADVLAVDFGHE